ncbi:hypothetical protein HK101_000218 [Irineochytrium annulatum]|nr:hypothetical protein HK101_000218 [Irineochytrium annulatum]
MVASIQRIKHVSNKLLFVSEPDPRMFGNPRNPTNNPNWTNGNWLKSRFHFAFAEYASYPRAPHQFGVLRVLNDDLVQPAVGFGAHPHRDMEIVTYIVDGQLSHKDSRGNEETLGAGAVQFMSAGRGVVHSERNGSDTEPVRFIQMWITTRERGVEPNYGSYEPNKADVKVDGWEHLVTDVKDNKGNKAPVRIRQDANIYVARLSKKGARVTFPVGDDRQVYLVGVKGEVTVADAAGEGAKLEMHDAAEIKGGGALEIVVTAESEWAQVLAVEMAKTDDSRFP